MAPQEPNIGRKKATGARVSQLRRAFVILHSTYLWLPPLGGGIEVNSLDSTFII
jgi:hypothetical protein